MSFVEKINTFVQSVWVESKKVSWPNREELQESTGVVMVAATIVMLYLFVVDRILTLMEQVEPLTQSRDGLDERTAQADRRVNELRATIEVHEAEIEGALTAAEIERADVADSIDPDHLTRYEQIQAGFGGVAVVSFVGKNCAGCPLSMPAVEADRVRKAAVGTLIDCQECGRLVVR